MNSSYDLGSRMKSGALWVYLQGWFGTVLQFSAGVALARIMEPADFGVFYAVSAYTAILSQQVNFGIPNALLQSRDLDDSQWNSAFWVMQGIAVLCTVLVFVFSGFISRFYSDQRYTSIMWLSCFNFFIMPYMAINGTLLRRAMDYKTTSRILMTSSFVGLVVSITFALLGFGPYSLLISGISSSILSTFLMARKAPWSPKLSFSWDGLKPLIKFGWRLHLNNSINALSVRVDNMMVGSMVGIAALGIYNRAFNLARLPVAELGGRLYQLLFSGLARVQDNMEYTKEVYFKTLTGIAIAIYPFLLLLILEGDVFIKIVYGEKWLPAATPMKIMAAGSFLIVISMLHGALIDAQGLVARATKIEIANIIMVIAVVWVGSNWGVTGVATGISIRAIASFSMLQTLLNRSHVKIGYKSVFRAIAPAASATAISGACGCMLIKLLSIYSINSLIGSALVCTLVLLVYFGCISVFVAVFPSHAWAISSVGLFKSTFHKVFDRIRFWKASHINFW